MSAPKKIYVWADEGIASRNWAARKPSNERTSFDEYFRADTVPDKVKQLVEALKAAIENYEADIVDVLVGALEQLEHEYTWNGNNDYRHDAPWEIAEEALVKYKALLADESPSP